MRGNAETFQQAHQRMKGKRRKFANPSWTASRSREDDWIDCCHLAKGFEWVDNFDNNEDEPLVIQQVINLLDDDGIDEAFDSIEETKDRWIENAIRIQEDLTRMEQWIRKKQFEYISLDMADDEASLIQSTVTTFAATTANELETLRKIIPSSSSNVASHRSGIVQILLSQLQLAITEPFGKLQKQRSRIAVHLWQNPQQCKLYQRKPSTKSNLSAMQKLLDEEDGTEREQRFYPRNADLPANDFDFFSKYIDGDEDLKGVPPRPSFLEQLQKNEQEIQTPIKKALEENEPLLLPKEKKAQRPQTMPYQQPTEEESRRQLEEDLIHESAQLTVVANNDLDSVQKMEQRMVEITTLISQFSNLVGEQQEEIIHIHDSAKESKENIDKGQENLVDATERTKKSKHWLAWIIFSMSMTLLFFHTLRN